MYDSWTRSSTGVKIIGEADEIWNDYIIYCGG